MSNLKGEKQYNTTITAVFDEPKFGRDASPATADNLIVEVKYASGKTAKKEFGSAFRSKPFDQSNLDAIKTMGLGDRLLIKLGPNSNIHGGRTFFVEIQKPQIDAKQAAGNFNSKQNVSSARQEDGI